LNSARLRTLPALTSAGADQGALELGKAAQDGEHERAMRRRGVRPRVLETAEASASLLDRVSTFSRSLVDLASRSRRVTTSTSPGWSRLSALTSSTRSPRAPDPFSPKILAQPAACSSVTWASRCCSRVEPRQYPISISSPYLQHNICDNKPTCFQLQEKCRKTFNFCDKRA